MKTHPTLHAELKSEHMYVAISRECGGYSAGLCEYDSQRYHGHGLGATVDEALTALERHLLAPEVPGRVVPPPAPIVPFGITPPPAPSVPVPAEHAGAGFVVASIPILPPSPEQERLKALSAAKEDERKTQLASINDIMDNKFTSDQRDIFAKILKGVGFRFQKGKWSSTAGRWMDTILAIAPEPWRLDLTDLRDWAYNPATALNDPKDADKTKARHIAKATARKLIIRLWREQVGTVAPAQAGATPMGTASDYSLNHPFLQILRMLDSGTLKSEKEILNIVRQYRKGEYLTEEEVTLAEGFIRNRNWMGRFDLSTCLTV